MPENIAIANGKDFDGRGPAFERDEVADTAYWDGKIADRAVDFLARPQVQRKDKKQPFFLAVGFMKPHLPFNAPAKYWDLYDPSDISMPATYYRAEGTPDVIHHNSGDSH